MIYVIKKGNVELPCPKLFQAFSVKFTLIFFHECVHSIIPHQHMQRLCILIQNCDFESTLKSRLRSRDRPIIGGYRPSQEIDPLSLIDRLHFVIFSRSKCSQSHNLASICIILACAADVE